MKNIDVNNIKEKLLNDGISSKFNNKLLAYSSLAGAVLAGVGSANASVVSNTRSKTLSTVGDTLNVQFNGNTKFIIRYTSHGGIKGGSLVPQSTGAQFIKTGAKYVKALGSNYTINTGRAFLHSSAQINFFYNIPSSNQFVGKGDKYVGVKFKDSGIKSGFIFGYIKVNVAAGATSIHIYGDAYENSLNSIKTNTNLPVELTTFTALANLNTVKLNWVTATEVNNYGFEIQRSNPPLSPLPGGEEKGWVKVGFVKGSGNSNSPKKYSFVDNTAASGKYYYRLKQIDNDGQFKYSAVVEATLNIPANFALNQNYPNPFNPSTTINFALPKTAYVELVIYNSIGQQVAVLVNNKMEAGYHQVSFNRNSAGQELASGIYFYRLTAGDFTQTRKMVLLK